MNSLPSLALTAGLLAYTGVSSAFVGYRLEPMVRKWKLER